MSLIEIVATVAIMGLLTAVVLPRMQSALRSSRAAAAVSAARVLQFALLKYGLDHGDFPAPALIPDYDGLRSTVAPYLDLPTDPWLLSFDFGSYTSSASSGNSGGTFSLLIFDHNQPHDAITISEAAISAPAPPGLSGGGSTSAGSGGGLPPPGPGSGPNPPSPQPLAP